MELVSVIIPTYNNDKFLQKCIESVLKQTYKNLEILVIDDGSTDNTAKIINYYMDSRIKYFYKKNGGEASARNFGIEKSIGEWIAFLDSDDFWDEKKIEKQMHFNNYDLIYCSVNLINENGYDFKVSKTVNYEQYAKNLKKNILKGNVISGSCSSVLIKSKSIKEVGFFREDLPMGADWEFIARLIIRGYATKFINQPLTSIRIHNNSIQRSIGIKESNLSKKKILLSFLKYDKIPDSNKAIIYKKLTEINYGLNSFTQFKTNYKKAISYNYSNIFDIHLLLLWIKFPLVRLIRR